MKAYITLSKPVSAVVLPIVPRGPFVSLASDRELEERAAIIRTFGNLKTALSFFKK